jgi:hypothetical protein
MTAIRSLALVALLATLTGCYTARIESGLTPSTTVIKKSFASCWIYGLVPPSTVKTAAECKDGVAIVQTRLSFLNQLVGAITFGIYTPMEITVTCATGSATGMRDGDGSMFLSEHASTEEAQQIFAQAADRAVTTRHAIFIRTIAAEEAAPSE